MSRLVDLSHVVHDGLVTYPGLPPVRITDHLGREASRAHYAPGVEFHIGAVEMVGNTGTYLDVPFHRYDGGYGLDELPLERIASVPGTLVSVGRREIDPSSLDGLEVRGRAVLFATGWDRHWGNERYGLGGHPHLTAATAQFLIDAGAAIVGIDSLNIDGTGGGERPVHSTLLAAGIPIVEHLTGLGGLRGLSFSFTAVPAKVRGLGSWPVRAFATVA